jgi:DNA (cytosine-5)-methyltransferase 1
VRSIDLFSGIGGFALGLERAGVKTVAFSEIEPYPSAVLKKHWPDVPNLGDITKVEDFPDADVVTAGFPCQDLSNAGKRAGLSGARSGLWREAMRAVRLVRPKLFMLENVAALCNRGLCEILGEVAAERYDAEWDCIPATAVGLPHRRLRVWVAAYSQRDEQSREKPRLGSFGRVGRFLKPVSQDGDWKAALSALRGMDDGLQRSVDRTDTLRNAIVSQIPEALMRAILDETA